jgi:TolB-like protein
MADTSFTDKPGYPLPPLDVAKKPSNRIKILVIVLVLAVSHVVIALLGFGLGCLLTDRGGSISSADSLAVLPFTGDWHPQGARDDWPEKCSHFLSVSIPDAVAKDVVEHAGGNKLRVIATHEVRGRKPNDQSPRQAGRDLGVQAVLSGKVSKDGLLSIQLIAVESGELLWGKTYQLTVDQAGTPIFHSSSEISMNVRQKLAGRR